MNLIKVLTKKTDAEKMMKFQVPVIRLHSGPETKPGLKS